jgi:hypothetical protein
MRRTVSPLVILAMMMGAVWSGCGTEPQSLFPNKEPNTRISSAPPERADASYSVNIFWYGWDDDGFVSHYEIAWENTDEWIGPIFGTDSLFTVAAFETCCVPPLPEHGVTPPDSVYEQFHTFFVRAVDNDGVPDPNPAHRSFNAKTIAPYTEIVFGPATAQFWSPNVKFTWDGNDDDGEVERYRYAVSSVKEFIWDKDRDGILLEYIAWIDTLSYRPLGDDPSQRGPSPWTTTEVDSIEFLIPEETTENLPIIFAVRSIDNAGAEERRLDRHNGTGENQAGNVSVFQIRNELGGPRISLSSNVAGSKRSGEAEDVREVFSGEGIRFEWSARPGESGVAIAGYSYAVDDTSQWTPFSPNDREYPPSIDGEEQFWFPETGDHAFFVRAIDFAGFINVLAMRLAIFGGPRFEDPNDRYIVVVLDSDPDQYIETQVLPPSYREAERGLVDYLFDGYDFILYQTQGEEKPDVSLLNRASSIFWFTTSDVASGDAASLLAYHVDPPNVLSSYVSAGGNLFLCGTQLTNNTRFFDDPNLDIPVTQNYPVIFSNTLNDTTWVPHWCATVLRIDRVDESVPSTFTSGGTPPELAAKRLGKAVSQIEGFPDLDFDPLTFPNGPVDRGCGLYDRGIVPLSGAQVLYRANDDAGPSIAIRKHISPGVNGNVVVLGFHPYFFQRPQVQEMIRAVLDEFGEVPTS